MNLPSATYDRPNVLSVERRSNSRAGQPISA
jgi:hypothetical protein